VRNTRARPPIGWRLAVLQYVIVCDWNSAQSESLGAVPAVCRVNERSPAGTIGILGRRVLKPGMSSATLWEQCPPLGEDPFIVAVDPR
jgi:hypothetical protein